MRRPRRVAAWELRQPGGSADAVDHRCAQLLLDAEQLVVPGDPALRVARVLTETVDDHRYGRLEHVAAPSRHQTFLYGAPPLSRTDWITNALFQFEVDVRAGVMLGIVGIDGLGFMFRQSLTYGEMQRASTFLLAMVLVTTVDDRLSRRLRHWRVGC